jgi:putative SOS response-associated peptidase YedK
MCGRYSLDTFDEKLTGTFDLGESDVPCVRYNIAPTQLAPVVRRLESDARPQLEQLRWGLIPPWAKDGTVGNRMINARSETVAEKPSFRKPLASQRCLVPATGFYEWKKVASTDGGKPQKQPFYIHRIDEGVFAFAGLWERWCGPSGETVESYTILTTTPNELMEPLHNRMPVILEPGDYGLWLDPQMRDVERLTPLLTPAPEILTAYPVSRHVNNPRNDDPVCLAPVP